MAISESWCYPRRAKPAKPLTVQMQGSPISGERFIIMLLEASKSSQSECASYASSRCQTSWRMRCDCIVLQAAYDLLDQGKCWTAYASTRPASISMTSNRPFTLHNSVLVISVQRTNVMKLGACCDAMVLEVERQEVKIEVELAISLSRRVLQISQGEFIAFFFHPSEINLARLQAIWRFTARGAHLQPCPKMIPAALITIKLGH